ncbi:uncharacterized protein LOC143215131 [Lasioglossum baleicum]|uniref:uncharacterized protein LOC143215131 n=1 Tax=Lasioglossum baleicum TaxID=434251 RepID=UPI003FCEA55D
MTVLKPLDTGLLYNGNRRMPPRGTKSLGSPVTPVDMPDLESIIRNFEMGFHSPSKKSAPKTVETPKQQPKNFVRKIVAALEVKYKPCNDLKIAQDAREAEETSKRFEILETKRKSGLFSSPFRSGSEEFRNSGKLFDTPKKSPGNLSRRSDVFSPPSRYSVEDSKAFRRSGVYGSPFMVSDDEGNSQDLADESKDAQDGCIISTPSKSRAKSLEILSPDNYSKDSSQSGIYSSPVHLECEDFNADGCTFFAFDNEASLYLDDTNTLDSIDLDMTLPEPDETIFLNELDDHELRKTSTAIDEYDQTEEDSLIDPPPVFRNDKTPKIIGAFLKKPIEVEDTSIDWIPITGKKLPRKRSLKKLLTSWATKRSFDKKNSMFSSERNLSEETRELQDSGYDERSSSSSSLTSLISITEALLRQEKSYIEPDRRTTFNSFRPRNSLNASDDKAFQDAGRNVSKQTAKLVLTEVPREQVKVDLGPVYPFPRMVTMSLNRKPSVAKKPAASPAIIKPSLPKLPKLPKHPHLSSLPKHPFVALTKLDEPEYDRDSVVIKNSLYEVEFRKSCTDLNSSTSSLESHYDVPRRFLSKSETQIPEICEVEFRKPREVIYDTPRRRHQERPKSSVYEDTLSRKRKSGCIGEKQPLYHYYSSPTCAEPHYATVKPIYNGLYHSREILPNSGSTASMKNAYAF